MTHISFSFFFFFLNAGPRGEREVFQVMCGSVCQCVTPNPRHESRLPVDYRCHHLRGMQLTLILSCSLVFLSLKCGDDDDGGGAASAEPGDRLRGKMEVAVRSGICRSFASVCLIFCFSSFLVSRSSSSSCSTCPTPPG